MQKVIESQNLLNFGKLDSQFKVDDIKNMSLLDITSTDIDIILEIVNLPNLIN